MITTVWFFGLFSNNPTPTFEIKKPLFTEPLLDLPSGQAGHLYQSVDLKQKEKIER